MMDTEMKSLRCGTEDHEPMDRLLENRDPLGPLGRVAFTLWICQACGVMALHLETPGDIYWYNAQSRTKTNDKPGAVRSPLWEPIFQAPFVGPKTHDAGCNYCDSRFACQCDAPGAPHMCPRCDDAAEESKMSGEFPAANAGTTKDF